jgi:hypothetical protein
MGKTKNIPDIFGSSHSMIASETGGVCRSFVLTETGSMSCPPNTLQFRATETVAEIARTREVRPGPPTDTLLDTEGISRGITKSDTYGFSEAKTPRNV